ncbi:MAG: TetR family transcriptional regulator [Yokenella regensburgei]|jgi:AcrR family transcriptional regulator|uniref:TetR family transcriptional regulator n=1 Tax=Yokenella regensburgei TaxID=158877 RepID=A0AB38FTI4_9ENTR|nr:TetR family transcriptional regulator [Yokenella regensburgei]KAF1369099.1 AcrR family transcriptional regulator [Yokenella regensburgei]KFD20562.1 TetR family transcriptional regulator [Yokenella regensburgei ATCC 49455]MDR3104673.1 TetR family transcriptional regulator [Yokenella regensburgei]QIU88863.1 TetR family transcriptional regulator [Yokenella regensburgei]RKR64591.1 TetR family transcriptional regulator [Yokenella regensburgei]
MSYLNREERREAIVQAAMRVALSGGFTAMTVRHIAKEAEMASGQVHHHFTSSGELKAEAFIRVIREMLDVPLTADCASWREKLFFMLYSEEGKLGPHLRLWREAQILSDSDSDIKAAYLLTMSMWHDDTVAIIQQGVEAGEFTLNDEPSGIAWRLISMVCGMDGVYALGLEEVDDEAFIHHLHRAITLELFSAPRL